MYSNEIEGVFNVCSAM